MFVTKISKLLAHIIVKRNHDIINLATHRHDWQALTALEG